MAECLHTFWCGRGSPGIASRTKQLVQEWDLTRPLPSSVAGGTAFDWVISMEVVEHIPPEYEAAFLAQITTYATKGTVLTWSDKGPSKKHPNALENAYVLKRMKGFGRMRLEPRRGTPQEAEEYAKKDGDWVILPIKINIRRKKTSDSFYQQQTTCLTYNSRACHRHASFYC